MRPREGRLGFAGSGEAERLALLGPSERQGDVGFAITGAVIAG